MKVISVVEERKPLVVEITPKEQDVILFALRKVGGNPEGPRGVLAAIIGVLENHGAVPLKPDSDVSHYLPDTWEQAYA